MYSELRAPLGSGNHRALSSRAHLEQAWWWDGVRQEMLTTGRTLMLKGFAEARGYLEPLASAKAKRLPGLCHIWTWQV